MNILIVCREIPYPLNAGYKIRTFNLIERLSQDNSITLLCYDRAGGLADSSQAMPDCCEQIKLVAARTDSKIRQLCHIMASALAGQPVCVKYVKSGAMKSALGDVLSKKRFDIVHFDDPYLASNYDFDGHRAIKKTVTFHDIDSHKYRRIFKIETSIRRKAMLLLDLLLVKRWEQTLVRKSDLCIVMSDDDALKLKGKGKGGNISVIPNGVDTRRFRFDRVTTTMGTVSFFGTMDYAPNQDAVLYFYREIWPLIRQAKPGAKFLVVGRNPSQDLKDLARDPSVVVTGDVEDVVPYYLESSVAVVPLRAGGGTRLKILEAMAIGCPVVSTSIGAEGLNVTDRENILLADAPARFAECTVELMTNDPLREVLAASARRLVERDYSWDQIADSMRSSYREMLVR